MTLWSSANSSLSRSAFALWTAICSAVVFVCNLAHTTQQGIYFNEYLPIARHLLDGHGYSIHTGVASLYPIWGYPILTSIGLAIGSAPIFLLIVQWVLSLVAVEAWYESTKLPRRRWHIPLLIPFFAVCSVKWPDAFVAILLVFAAALLIRAIAREEPIVAVLSGLALGAVLNFRSEYLGLPVLLACLSVGLLVVKKRKQAMAIGLAALAAVLSLLPWALYTHSASGHARLTASNGGGVLYISLGQLSSNPWGIAPTDSAAYAAALAHGVPDPYSAEGDSLLTAEFLRDASQRPGSFATKCAGNLVATVTRGVYTGEYAAITLDSSERARAIASLSSGSIGERLAAFRSLPIGGELGFAAEKGVQAIFAVLFAGMLIVFALTIRRSLISTYGVLSLLLMLYKLALVVLIQYEPRHMNAVYLFLLGSVLMYVEARRRTPVPTV